MQLLYPLTFKTQYKDKIWGGQKIKTVLGKDFGKLPNCGETWEISGVKGNVSEVANGELIGKPLTELIETYKERLLGKKVYEKYGSDFPLLVKFIDANEDLSVQVHPDDKLAKERHDSFGKTEMWYVIQADKGAKLVSGFNKDTSKEEYLEKLNSGKLYDILNQEDVEDDDVFFLPAGRVHTIGKGLLIAEIQQTSDITYRIYDFDRTDDKGNKRELHTEEAVDAIDYKKYAEYKTKYENNINRPVELVNCAYFKTNKIEFNTNLLRDYKSYDSFAILVCLEGHSKIMHENMIVDMKKGDCFLIPAELEHIELVAEEKTKILESYIP